MKEKLIDGIFLTPQLKFISQGTFEILGNHQTRENDHTGSRKTKESVILEKKLILRNISDAPTAGKVFNWIYSVSI